MIYFLSDAHLGSRAIENPQAHQQTVIAMLQRMAKDASTITYSEIYLTFGASISGKIKAKNSIGFFCKH
jgi:hypothetical protein